MTAEPVYCPPSFEDAVERLRGGDLTALVDVFEATAPGCGAVVTHIGPLQLP